METINRVTDKSIIKNVQCGDNVSIRDFVNLYGCSIGDETKIGTFVEIQSGVTIGKRCKIQSHTFICEGVHIGDGVFVVEGPRIERMLGYTNLESEKGFMFFQNFLKDNGILEELENLGINEGDTVRMYGLQFDYYK